MENEKLQEQYLKEIGKDALTEKGSETKAFIEWKQRIEEELKEEEIERLEINEIEIEAEEKGKPVKKIAKIFWVLVGKDKLYLYANKNKAIVGLKEILPNYEETTIAEIVYVDVEGKGTFNVEGVSWKDIALGWASKDEKKTVSKTKE